MNKISIDVPQIEKFVQNVKNRVFVHLNSLELSKEAFRPCLQQVIESGLCVQSLRVHEMESHDYELLKSIKGLVDLRIHPGKTTSFTALELVKMNSTIKYFKFFEAYRENFLGKVEPHEFDLVQERRDVEFEFNEKWFTLGILVFREWLKGNIPDELLQKLIEKGFVYCRMYDLPIESLRKFYNSPLGKLYISQNKNSFLKGDQYIDREGIILSHLEGLLATKDEKSRFLALAFSHRAWKFVLKEETIPSFLNEGDFYLYVRPEDLGTQHQLVEKGWKPQIKADYFYRYQLLRLMLHARGVLTANVNEIMARFDPDEMAEFLKHEKVVPLNKQGENLYHYVLKNGRFLQFQKILPLIEDFSPFFSEDKSGKTPLDYASPHEVQAIFEAKEKREAKQLF